MTGDNISDEDRVVHLLASLPEMLVTALEANPHGNSYRVSIA